MISLDYRGARVLAAYQQVPILNTGVVAKMDLAPLFDCICRLGLAAALLPGGLRHKALGRAPAFYFG